MLWYDEFSYFENGFNCAIDPSYPFSDKNYLIIIRVIPINGSIHIF